MNYSKRLKYQKITSADWENYLLLVQDEKVMKLITGEAFSAQKARESFIYILEINQNNRSFGYFSIRLKTSSNFIGYTKLVLLKNGTAELGYMLFPEFWGNGFGSEVAEFMVNYARSISSLKIIEAVIDPGNVASAKILKKSGFHLYKTCTMEGLPAEVYKLPINIVSS